MNSTHMIKIKRGQTVVLMAMVGSSVILKREMFQADVTMMATFLTTLDKGSLIRRCEIG